MANVLGVTFRKAVDKDVTAAAALMRSAFKMWEPIGYNAAGLTEAVVRSFFVRDGYVAQDEDNKLAGCVCINFTKPQISGKEMRVSRAHRIDTTELMDPTQADFFSESTFAYFYSLAIDPACSKRGLGRTSLQFVEDQAMQRRCGGILLETGKRTGWLVDWYERSGFRLIGEFIRDSEPLVFMLKKV
jgi:ribosomal protein S18 acetylase RimI-like enzyme